MTDIKNASPRGVNTKPEAVPAVGAPLRRVIIISLQIPMFPYVCPLNGVTVSGIFSNIFKKRKARETEISAAAVLSGDGDGLVLRISGDWLLKNARTPFEKIGGELSSRRNVSSLKVDAGGLGEYDSALTAFLLRVWEMCSKLSINFDAESLPEGPRALLRLATAVPEADEASRKSAAKRGGIFGKVGTRAIGVLSSFNSISEFVGEVAISFALALAGRARYRGKDLALLVQRSGPEALPIVTLISFLVGLILAFVGAIQLAKYGSEIFVADLVGIAMVREMGAIMVGIVMSGRTGAAFAAELGSMKVNEEISAFRTFGISPMEFLVFPRILALVLVFPLLTIFADVIGMMGGLAIGVGMFDISYEQYANRSVAALNLVQLSTGIGKSIVFGLIVGVIGCRQGLACEKSSSGVGLATTSAVVQSVTWIIVADAVFAVIFTIFDI